MLGRSSEEHATLDELLTDPVGLTMMARDGVRPAEVRALVLRVLRALEDREAQAISEKAA